MTDKQINTCEFFNICKAACGGTLEDTEMCHCYELYKQLKLKEQECEELKKQVKELRQGWVNCDKERNLQEANSEFNQRVINRYKQTLTEIKEIAEICSFTDSSELLLKRIKQILLEISEVENEYDIKSDMIAQEEKKKIKRSECPYGGIDCAWCGEDCE